ncbi:MAG: addiction module protein [Candidatus Hydrogenedentes bacterium]|nr:addiction module protein [Candidatus Hydrogenedentota bacterium]
MTQLDIKQMSMLERIQAMEALWDSLCHEEKEILPPDWHAEILRTRGDKLNSGNSRFLTLEQVKALSRT